MLLESPIVRRTTLLLATWFGCGKSPVAPGTVGTLGAIPLVWAFAQMPPLAYMLSTLILSIAAIWIAHLHEAITGEHDCGEVVIDEVAGFAVTMVWVPFTWPYLLAGFAIFRLLDALKPFPISYIDREVKGGVGAVGDDLVAGILSNIILQLLLQQRLFL
jgi:phosphatidylglycerophosphatase A